MTYALLKTSMSAKQASLITTSFFTATMSTFINAMDERSQEAVFTNETKACKHMLRQLNWILGATYFTCAEQLINLLDQLHPYGKAPTAARLGEFMSKPVLAALTRLGALDVDHLA